MCLLSGCGFQPRAVDLQLRVIQVPTLKKRLTQASKRNLTHITSTINKPCAPHIFLNYSILQEHTTPYTEVDPSHFSIHCTYLPGIKTIFFAFNVVIMYVNFQVTEYKKVTKTIKLLGGVMVCLNLGNIG